VPKYTGLGWLGIYPETDTVQVGFTPLFSVLCRWDVTDRSQHLRFNNFAQLS